METVQVEGCDGVVIDVEVSVVAMCLTIKTMLDNLGARGEDNQEETISLPIHSDIITKVFQWSQHHIEDPPPPNEEAHEDIFHTTISSWDKEFLEVGPEMLIRLMKAASFLNIKGLLYMSAKMLASLITGKEAPEIRELFHIKEEEVPGPSAKKQPTPPKQGIQ